MRLEQSLWGCPSLMLGFLLAWGRRTQCSSSQGMPRFGIAPLKRKLSSLIGHPSGLGGCHHGECKWQRDGKGGKGGWGGAALDEVSWQVCKVCMRIKSFLKHTKQLHTSARIFGVFSHLNSQVNIGRDYSVSNWAFIEILACRPNRCT